MKKMFRNPCIDKIISIEGGGGVLLVSIFVSYLLLSGCKHSTSPDTTVEVPQTVVLTLKKGGDTVSAVKPERLTLKKGIKWSEVKAKITVSYKDGYEAAGFRLDKKDGAVLKDDYVFTENKTVFVLSKAKGLVYTVEHWQQNIENDEYTKIEKDTETKTGTINTLTEAQAKPYEGFTAQTFSQVTIKADGSTVVQIKYDRKIITLTLDLAGGSTTTALIDGEAGKKLLQGKFGAAVTDIAAPAKTGYTFSGWNPVLPETFPAENTGHTAQWAAEGDYSIAYHLNGGTDNGGNPVSYNVESETITLNDAIRLGYTFKGWFADESLTGSAVNTIKKGSTGNKVFWAKWELATYSITYRLNGGTDNGGNPASYSVESETINLNNAIRPGYTFKGWFTDEGLMGSAVNTIEKGSTGNKAFWAKWEAQTDIPYTVEHWQQNSENDAYTKIEADTEQLTGTTDGNTNAQAKTYEGFTAKPVSQVKIKADGSTVVRIKYDRKIITLTLDLAGGSTTTALMDGEAGKKLLQGKFGAPVQVKTPTKSGSAFYRWNPALPQTFPPSSPAETYTAEWSDKYRVTLAGDDRIHITAPDFITVPLNKNKTWGDIKALARTKTSVQSQWQADYAIYEWRLEGEDGEALSDDYPIDRSLTVYAVTNYTKFRIEDSTLKGYTGARPEGNIIIPETVILIDSYAFFGCTGLTQLALPDNLTTIGGSAFSGCTGLTGTLVFPASLKNINGGWGNTTEGAFKGCTNLTGADFSACTNLTAIGSSAFEDCSGLTQLALPDNLTTIGYYAFAGCTGLTGTIVFPASLKTLGFPENWDTYKGCFEGCTKLTGLDLSACASLTKIGKAAFSGCTGLTQLALPDNLATIGNSAFKGCTGLTQLALPDNLTTIGASAFYGCTELTGTIVFPANLKTLASPKYGYYSDDKGCFQGCAKLTGIDFSACTELTTIGASAFAGCTRLTGTIAFPASLKTIEDGEYYDPYPIRIVMGSFEGCTNLTALDFSACNKLTTIGKKAFKNCTGLMGTLVFPASLTTIGGGYFNDTLLTNGAFAGCANLTGLDLSACTSLTAINEYTFSGCTGLTQIRLPINLKTVSGFQRCTGLTSIDFSACTDLTTIGKAAFKGCTALTQLTLPKRLTAIGSEAFLACRIETLITKCNVTSSITQNLTQQAAIKEHLKNLTIEEGVTAIDKAAFGGCSLETLLIKCDVTKSITQNLVQNVAVKKLTFGENVTTIDKAAFKGWTGLTGTIVFPASLKNINGDDSSFGYTEGAFQGCTNLTAIDFSACTELTGIGIAAFKGCTGLTQLALPDNLAAISKGAFEDCTGLTGTIVFPASLKTLGGSYNPVKSAFGGCTNLTGADFSACTELTEIGRSAFKGCTGLAQIKLPANLTTINEYAFEGCTGLTDIQLPANLTTIDSHAFKGCTRLTQLALPANLTTINSWAFEGCTGLTGIDFSKCTRLNMSYNNNNIVDGCTNLTNIDLSGCTSLTRIGWSGFQNCTGLTQIKLPANLTTINSWAFEGCTNLISAVFANTNGWAVYDHGSSGNKVADIVSNDLADPAKAAEYLRSTFADKHWKRN
ncbi:MAG: leucine-rich repeat protein [Treponema sp.]